MTQTSTPSDQSQTPKESSHSIGPRPGLTIGLLVAGILSTVIYGYLTYLSFGFEFVPNETPDLWERLQARPILWVLALFGILFSVYLFGLSQVGRWKQNRQALWLVIGFGILFRATLLYSTPIQEIDLYRYIWDGQVLANGYNPYHFSPEQVRGGAVADNPDLLALRKLATESEGLETVVSRIHFEELRTIYPPVSQCVFAAAARTTPRSASTHTHATIMKCWLVLFDVLTIFLVVALLNTCGRDPIWVIAYAWCPLVLKEFANGGHLDSITIFLSTLAILLSAKAIRFSVTDPNRPSTTFALFLASAIAMGLAIGAKIYPVVLLPLFAVLVFRLLKWWQAILLGVVAGGLSLALLWPLGFTEEQPSQLNAPLSPAEIQAKSNGLKEFFNTFEMNDFLFMLIVEHLKTTDGVEPEYKAWFLLNSDAQRKSWIEPFTHWFDLPEHQAAYRLSRMISYSIVLLIVGYLCLRLNPKDPSSLAHVCFLALAWFWLLSPTQNPWYWCWCLPLIPFVKNRTWYLMAGFALVYYSRFWFSYHYSGEVIWPIETRFPSETVSPIHSYRGDNFFNYVIVCLEFGPWFLLLATETIWNLWAEKPKRNADPVR